MHTALGYNEKYRSGVLGSTRVPGFLNHTVSQTAFSHGPKGGLIDGNILNNYIILILNFFAILQLIFSLFSPLH